MLFSRLLFCLFLLSFVGLFPAAAQTDTASSKETTPHSDDPIFRKALEKRLAYILADEPLDRTKLSVEVFSLTRQETLFSLNPKKVLSPASLVKVITAVVALNKLGASFRHETRMIATGPLRNGVLQGDLVLVGGGDPTLHFEDLMKFVEVLERAGVKKVDGQVLVDDGHFDSQWLDPSRISFEVDKPYNAPVSALSVDGNVVSVYVRPASRLGQPPIVDLHPQVSYLRIRNRAKTSGAKELDSLKIIRTKSDQFDTIEVSGSLPLGSQTVVRDITITQPPLFAHSAFLWHLDRAGIKLEQTAFGRPKSGYQGATLFRFKGEALREILVAMNKDSDNFLAEMLVKSIGKTIGGEGTMKKGLQVIEEHVQSIGVDVAGLRVVSGSGLTRGNRMSATQFVSVINNSYLSFDHFPELLSSLAVAGRDGTLERRMAGTAAFGRLRGKTGTINGVSSLGGVVQSKGGELIAFAIIMNDNHQNPGGLRPWQNYFAQALAEFNRRQVMGEKPTPLTNDGNLR